MTFLRFFTFVIYSFLLVYVSSLEAAGVLRNATLRDNDLMSISRFSHGWRQVAHSGAIGGEHAYNHHAGGWVEVDLPGEYDAPRLTVSYRTERCFIRRCRRIVLCWRPRNPRLTIPDLFRLQPWIWFRAGCRVGGRQCAVEGIFG